MLISSRCDQGTLWTVCTWEAGLSNQGKGNAQGIVLGVSARDVNVELLLTSPLLSSKAFHCDLLLAPRGDGAGARGHREHAESEEILQKTFQERLTANSCALSTPAKSMSCLGLQLDPSPPSGQGRMTLWPKGLRPTSLEKLQACLKWQRESSLSVKNEAMILQPLEVTQESRNSCEK